MTPLAWIHIIVGTIVITIATIIDIKDKITRRKHGNVQEFF
jgi:hypothetical protein